MGIAVRCTSAVSKFVGSIYNRRVQGQNFRHVLELVSNSWSQPFVQKSEVLNHDYLCHKHYGDDKKSDAKRSDSIISSSDNGSTRQPVIINSNACPLKKML
ncbi:hypothetical protein PsorP6_003874 [Peronosclerospora sorghi]|uniref:Uncharacterized protein n=1 Tax=Peronosclerospora sorghi TaxID=230839 RepID=A0ACC0VL81_9STRA|nr:hypothetical protein PsorP6_003874 [Peronosclerospora sorghi]